MVKAEWRCCKYTCEVEADRQRGAEEGTKANRPQPEFDAVSKADMEELESVDKLEREVLKLAC